MLSGPYRYTLPPQKAPLPPFIRSFISVYIVLPEPSEGNLHLNYQQFNMSTSSLRIHAAGGRIIYTCALYMYV